MARCFFLGRFSGEGEDRGSGAGGNPEVRRLELIQHRTDCGNEAGALGIEQEAESSRYPEPEDSCGLSCQGIVKDGDGVL